tara:strand:- start:2665 stop:3843 length:1179 start_codon:yes stop_codon:yes gene_type:complete
MKVDISVIGRFHAFNLAKYFQYKKILNKLITPLPKYSANNYDISSENIVSCWWCELIVRLIRKLRLVRRDPGNISIYHNCYMRSVEAHVKSSGANVFIGFAGVSLNALKIAKSRGMLTILERGSSHRRFQTKILKEEYMLSSINANNDFSENQPIFLREMEEYRVADYISVPSQFVARTFVEEGIDRSRLLINPYGVDLEEFSQIQKKDQVFRIIFSGSGCLRKGYHYLLQAFYELNLKNCELWHLGSVNEEVRPYLDRFKHKNWIFKGHIPQKKLYEFYSQGSVLVLPSLEEGFAMVQFQAMACGLPLICTTNTGGEDLISSDGEEGFVVPIRDVDAIKQKLKWMYDNQHQAEIMGKKAKQKILSGFSWDDYGDRYVKNLKMALKENSDQT